MRRPTASVADRREILDRIIREVKADQPQSVGVGWLQQGVAEYMVVHEFGGVHTPMRAPMARSFDSDVKKIEEDQRRIADSILTGKRSFDQGLGVLGARAALRLKQHIATDSFPPPLAQSTLKQKNGRGKTMVWTGVAKYSVSWDKR